MKSFNIDQLIEEQAIEIILNGKAYKIKDLPIDLLEQCTKEDGTVDNVKFVAKILKTPEAEIGDYGLITLAKIVELVTENLLSAPGSQATKSEG